MARRSIEAAEYQEGGAEDDDIDVEERGSAFQRKLLVRDFTTRNRYHNLDKYFEQILPRVAGSLSSLLREHHAVRCSIVVGVEYSKPKGAYYPTRDPNNKFYLNSA